MDSLAALIAELLPTLQVAVDAAVEAALAKERRLQGVSGTAVSVSTGVVTWAPDDTPTTYQAATRMHPDIVAGSRIIVFHMPPSGALAFGPIPI